MGMIQSALNQLTLGIAGATVGVAKGLKGDNNPAPKPVKKETTQQNYGPTVLEGEQYDYTARLGSRPYNKYAAALAAQKSGNDIIGQKARSSFKTAEERLSDIRNQQTNSITQNAINEFGLTSDVSKGLYLLPDGQMIDGTYKGSTRNRSVDHRDIASSYEGLNINLPDDSNSAYMIDFMKRGNIRLQPESGSIDILEKPTSKQMDAIYKMFNSGKLESINITNPNSQYGESLDYIEDIESEEQIANLIKKHFSGGKE